MKLKKALIGFSLLTIFYLLALVWVDARNQVFAGLPQLFQALPQLLAFALCSWSLRFMRWRWLLGRAGCKTRLVPGLLAYLAGFAFTATPGKVGELVRIRYFSPQGVPASTVIAAFVYERSFDLLAVLILASLFISRMDVFIFVVGFVALFIGAVLLVAMQPRLLGRIAVYLRAMRAKKVARMAITLRDGLSGCRVWATPLDVLVAGMLGLLGWSAMALAFVYLLAHLAIDIPLIAAISTYPLSMLAGAASMLPGGVGSTEATIVAMLALHGVTLSGAALAAIGIRLATLWFAILCGFLALAVLEWKLANQSELPARE